jgi:rhodanese-related sulfurtransferase
MNFKPLTVLQLPELQKESETVILDIRDKQSFEADHIPGALLISDQVVSQLIRTRSRNRSIVVYCYRGVSSKDICRLLASAGMPDVYNLEGGWQAWAEVHQKGAAAMSGNATRWMQTHGFENGKLNSRIDNAMSPVMVAAKEGNSEILWELLEAGADVNLLNDDENPALWFACFNGNTDIIKMLISYGAKLDNQNVNGATCLIYAASAGKFDVVKTLVEAGAEIKTQTLDGFNALDSAASLPVLKYLKTVYTERYAKSA